MPISIKTNKRKEKLAPFVALIMKNLDTDSKKVAKIVLINDNQEVLMLKRAPKSKKHANEWDLPGGHIKNSETPMQGLKREVQEETNISVKHAKFYKKQKNKSFFYSKYKKTKIKLSDEHTEFAFFGADELDPSKKFQKIALEVLKRQQK